MPVAARVNDPAGSEPATRTWTGLGRIDTGADVAHVLAAVRAAGRRRDRTAALTRVVDRAEALGLTEPDGARILPVVPELAGLLPWPGGIRRGATLAATGSTSLLFTLLADAMAQGAWGAVVGMPDFSALPATEYGIDLGRLALVPRPGEDWPTVVAALIDGFDVVVAASSAVAVGTARALMARARQRGCVLIPTSPWPGCDVTVEVVERRWLGVGHGRGRLRAQEVTVRASGRGRAERPRQVSTTLPPPSLAARVGPLPGQIPGLPIGDPDRVHATGEAALRPRPAPTPPPADPWRALMSGQVTAGSVRYRKRAG